MRSLFVRPTDFSPLDPRLPIKTTSGFRDPKKVLAIEIFSGIYFWSKLQNKALVNGICLQELDY